MATKKGNTEDDVFFAEGTYVWLTDRDRGYLPAKVMTSGSSPDSPGSAMVMDTGLLHEFLPLSFTAPQQGQVVRMDTLSLSGIDDLDTLRDISVAAVLHNLDVRFSQKQIYTALGPSLICVNPNKVLRSNSAAMMDEYKQTGGRNMPPHIYSIADRAYWSLVRTGKSQSCVVQGEAASGKSETARSFLRYIVNVSCERSGAARSVSSNSTTKSETLRGKKIKADLKQQATALAEQILAVDNVLNALGCVSTMRHERASRVGKIMQVVLETNSGRALGANVSTFLLDTRLVTSTRDGEGNFRILHGLCAKAKEDSKFRRWLKLGPISEFRWLSGGAEAEPEDGARTLDQFTQSLLLFGVAIDDLNEILRLLAGLLHLGNVTFGAKAKVLDREALGNSAKLLGISAVDLELSLCGDGASGSSPTVRSANVATVRRKVSGRKMTSSPADVSGSATSASPADIETQAAEDRRDALAKSIYVGIFEFVIHMMNEAMQYNPNADSRDPVTAATISILDPIYANSSPGSDNGSVDRGGAVLTGSGPEDVLQRLCVNYANETVHEQFCLDFLASEVRWFDKHGLDARNVSIGNNTPCLRAIGDPNYGLLSLIERRTLISHGSLDTVALHSKWLLSQVVKRNTPDVLTSKLVPSPASQQSSASSVSLFTIAHYSGQAEYTLDGLIPKYNNHSLRHELSALAEISSSHLLSEIIHSASAATAVFEERVKVAKMEYLPNDRQGFMSSLSRRVSGSRGGSLSPKTKTKLVSEKLGEDGVNSHSVMVTERTLRQVGHVVNVLEKSEIHHIICLRSNATNTPLAFDAQLILAQLKRSGVAQICAMRQDSYPVQMSFHGFLLRYNNLEQHASDVQEMCLKLTKRGLLLADHWQAGHSFVLMTNRAYFNLERCRSVTDSAHLGRKLRSHSTGNAMRRKKRSGGIPKRSASEYPQGKSNENEPIASGGEVQGLVQLRSIVDELREAVQSGDAQLLHDAVLHASAQGRMSGSKTKGGTDDVDRLLARAKTLLKEVTDVAAAAHSAREAIDEREESALQEALDIALINVERENKVRQALSEATADRDALRLRASIIHAKQSGLKVSQLAEFKQAVAMQVRLDEEAKKLQILDDALKVRDARGVHSALLGAMLLGGLDHHPLVEYAKRQLRSGVPLPRDLDAATSESYGDDGDDLNSLASDDETEEGGADQRRVKNPGGIPKVGGMTSVSVAGTLHSDVRTAMSLNDFDDLSVVDAGKLAGLEAEMRAKQEETLILLTKATNARDLEQLQELRIEVIKYNVRGAEVDRAMDVYVRLNRRNQRVIELLAVTEAMIDKAHEPAGISGRDIEELMRRIAELKARGLDSHSNEVRQAEVLQRKLRTQFRVQKLLSNAIASSANVSDADAIEGMQRAIERARKHDLVFLSLVGEAKARIAFLANGGVVTGSEAVATNISKDVMTPNTKLSTDLRKGSSVATEAEGKIKLNVSSDSSVGSGDDEGAGTTKRRAVVERDLQNQKGKGGANVRGNEVLIPQSSIPETQQEKEQRLRIEKETEAIALELLDIDDSTYEISRNRHFRYIRRQEHIWTNFKNIRTDADFEQKGIGGRVMASLRPHAAAAILTNKLTHQRDPLRKSLTVLDKSLSDKAVHMHVAILAYCGDIKRPFPIKLAGVIIATVIHETALVDELYAQLCKQLTDNPDETSTMRAWQLMAMTVIAVVPSQAFETFIMQFLLLSEHEYTDDTSSDGVLTSYASYSLRRLESSLIRGPTGEVPSDLEVRSFQLRAPVVIMINLMDGSNISKQFPCHPLMTVGQVTEICKRYLSLKDDRQDCFGMFFYEQDEYDRSIAANNRGAIKRGDVSGRKPTHRPPSKRRPDVTLAMTVKEMPVAELVDRDDDLPSAMLTHPASSQGGAAAAAAAALTVAPTGAVEEEEVPTYSDYDSGSSESSIDSDEETERDLERQKNSRPFIARPPDTPRSTPRPIQDKEEKLLAKIKRRFTPRPPSTPAPNKGFNATTPVWNSLSPTPLSDDEFFSEYVSMVNGRRPGARAAFIFRRRYFPDRARDTEPTTDDMYMQLLYVEAATEVARGHWIVPEESVMAKLAALSVVIELGSMPSTSVKMLLAKLSDYFPRSWLKGKSEMGWAKLVHTQRSITVDKTKTQLCSDYVDLCRGLQAYGTLFFSVKRQRFDRMNEFKDADGLRMAVKPLDRVLLGVNCNGVTVHSRHTKRTLKDVPYNRINFCDNTSPSKLIVGILPENGEKKGTAMLFFTPQAKAIADVLYHYNASMVLGAKF